MVWCGLTNLVNLVTLAGVCVCGGVLHGPTGTGDSTVHTGPVLAVGEIGKVKINIPKWYVFSVQCQRGRG